MPINIPYFIVAVTGFTVACAHLALHPNCSEVDQCAAVKTRSSNVVLGLSSDALTLDSSALELALSRLKFDSGGEIIFTLGLASTLSSASAILERQPSSAQWQRIAGVVHNSFPSRNSARIVDLLKKFHHYYYASRRLAENSIINANSGPGNDAPSDHVGNNESSLLFVNKEIQQQQYRVHMQNSYLGEHDAHKLFAKQNLLADHLLQLRRIDADPKLSQKQKKQQSEMIQTSLNHIMMDTP